MIHAYDKIYLEKARTMFGKMLDFAKYDLGYELRDFYELFLNSPYSFRFEKGSASVIAGRSGIELAYDIIGDDSIKPRNVFNRSKEYWAGWALSYYQWYTSLSFKEINSFISIDEIVMMYPKYHEMDISHFVEKLNEIYQNKVTCVDIR